MKTTKALFASLLAGIVAAAALAAGAGRRDQAQAPTQVEFTNGATAAQIPIEMAGNEIFVPVRVNARQPSSFLLDTGSITSGMDPERARKLALEIGQTVPGQGPGGGLPIDVISNVRLELPGVRLFLTQLVAVPLESFGGLLGHPVEGRLGEDVLRRFVVEINYTRQTLQFYDPRAFRYSGHGAKLPVRLVDGLPHVAAKIAVPSHSKVEGDFLIDTGSDFALSLSEFFARSHGVLTRRLKTIQSRVTGEGGQVDAVLARLAGFELGPYRLEQPVAAIHAMPALLALEHGGIIGPGLLSRFTVIFDLPNNRLILEPNQHFREPFEEDMSGIQFIATGLRLETFEVRSVLPDSPAAQAGVRPGDVLVGLDGEPAQSYALADIRSLFKREGHTHELLLRRGNEQITVELTLRRLL